MRRFIGVCFVGFVLIAGTGARYPQAPPLKRGISVEMPVVDHATEVRAADEPSATVVVITGEGKIFAGVDPALPAALSSLKGTIYLKADARAPYQQVLTVLDALRGKAVVLLSAPPANLSAQDSSKGRYVSPYGTKLSISR